jgi:hypothetical protein
VTPRGRDCAAASCTSGSRPRRGPAEGDDRGSRIEREKMAADRRGHGEGERSLDSEGLKVNGLRGIERSTPSRDTTSSAGFGQSSHSGCRSLDRARRPSCSNESVRVEKVGLCGVVGSAVKGRQGWD